MLNIAKPAPAPIARAQNNIRDVFVVLTVGDDLTELQAMSFMAGHDEYERVGKGVDDRMHRLLFDVAQNAMLSQVAHFINKHAEFEIRTLQFCVEEPGEDDWSCDTRLQIMTTRELTDGPDGVIDDESRELSELLEEQFEFSYPEAAFTAHAVRDVEYVSFNVETLELYSVKLDQLVRWSCSDGCAYKDFDQNVYAVVMTSSDAERAQQLLDDGFPDEVLELMGVEI